MFCSIKCKVCLCSIFFEVFISSLFLQDTPAVPMGRSPRTDVLLKAENVVLDHGGCVLRLAGLYISFLSSDLFLVSLESRYVLGKSKHIL